MDHPCIEGYGHIYIDNNHYFYAVLDDFPSDSKDENLSNSDDDPDYCLRANSPETSAYESDLEDSDEDEIPLAHHFIDLVIVNAWLRYRQDMIKEGLDQKDILDSLGFRAEIAEGLCLMGKGTENTRKRGRPSSSGTIEREYQEKKKEKCHKANSSVRCTYR
ncbi:hypothetical protein NQ318_015160 [Aromia moschata]|uniref:Uncharacterized protein n=1 Tax=Aromia moschata TaxID=1265417 RepID=A0AAV8XZG5_9CUCU|nr:hypothetical protein NQ318_015160 [Aromia moschata]